MDLKEFFETFKREMLDYKSPAVSTVIVTLIIITFMVIVMIKLKKHNPNKPPKGIVLLAEMLVTWTNGICKDTLGSRWKKFAPWVLFEGIFLLISNYSGLLGLTPPTGSIVTPIVLGIITGFIIHAAAIKYSGIKDYLKSYLDPIAIMLPINIFSELVTPIAMGLRLFGNIFSGTMVMSIIYYVLSRIVIGSVFPLGTFLTPIITPVFHAIFDVFLGFIQVFVFMLLTVVFISGKIPEEE